MVKSEVRVYLMSLLSERLALFDIKETEVNESFDLVKSGLLDSMAFVDLVADVEEHYDIEIDFENLADDPAFTSLGGLLKIIMDA